MIILYLLLGVVLGIIFMQGIYNYSKIRPKPESGIPEKEKVNITPEDISRLLAVSITQDIGSLIIEYEIYVKIPEFYKRFQALCKYEKDLYCSELIDIFSKNKWEYVRGLFDEYPGFTNQDALLLLLSEMSLGNKMIARIMGLSLTTLKKRKTRLNLKMRSGKV